MRSVSATSKELSNNGIRLDASYHVSSGHQAFMQLTQSGKKLEGLSKLCLPGGIYIPTRFKRIFVDDPAHGAPYITGGSIVQSEPWLGAKLLSIRYTENVDRLSLKSKMIIITCSGDIGNTVYINDSFHGSVGSPDLIRVLADPNKILSGYLYIYLSSQYARALIKQKTYGAVIPHIEAHHVFDLPIPRLATEYETRIHSLIDESSELLIKAYKLIKQARDDSIAANNLPTLALEDYYFYGNCRYPSKKSGTFLISSSRLSILTINAWNYADKFMQIREKIKRADFEYLSNLLLSNGYRTGRSYKRVQTQTGHGIELIGQKDLFGLKKVGKWISQLPIGSLESEIVTDGTILLAGVGTNAETEVFGRCEFVWQNFEGKVPVAEIIRIKADDKKLDPGYLYAFLSSEYGFRLLRSTITGTKLCRFIEPLVMELPIPIPTNKRDMINIGDNVRKAYSYRARAIDLENQAQQILSDSLQG